MSLAIDVDTVTAVLLADGWHDVADESFELDSYEFLWSGRRGVKVEEVEHDPILLHGGGHSGICAAGFSFKTADGKTMCGPLSSVLAVRL
jgi:hypothetical protein